MAKISDDKKAQIKKACLSCLKAVGISVGTCVINIVTIVCNPEIVQTVINLFK